MALRTLLIVAAAACCIAAVSGAITRTSQLSYGLYLKVEKGDVDVVMDEMKALLAHAEEPVFRFHICTGPYIV